MELLLVGVVHRDPSGYEALRRLLENLRPEAVCLELSPLGLLWRERNGPRLMRRLERLASGLPPGGQNHLELMLIREALALPFEYRACRDHGSEEGIAVHLIDLNRLSRESLSHYEAEIVTAANLRALATRPGLPLGQVMERARARARRCILEGFSPWDPERRTWDEEPARRRERFLACRVREAGRRHGRVLYVGGWVHLVPDAAGRSLACLLGDLTPRRVLLGQEELLPMPHP